MKYLWIVIPTLFLIAAISILRPVPILPLDKCIEHTGILEKLYQTKGEDFVFIFENSKTRFYINRALDSGLNIDTLNKKLINKTVSVYYPEYYTPLDHNTTIRHLCHVIEGDETIYNEYELVNKKRKNQ